MSQNLPARRDQGEMLLDLIEKAATDSNIDVEKLERLLDVQERWSAGQARQAYIEAMMAFQADPPRLIKDQQGGGGRGGTFTYVSLGKVADAIKTAMAPHGLAFAWRPAHQDGDHITVTCVVSHIGGHSEEASLTGAPDNTGSKNTVQAVGSTITYLQRYTLFALTGLVPEDADDDGAGARDQPPPRREPGPKANPRTGEVVDEPQKPARDEITPRMLKLTAWAQNTHGLEPLQCLEILAIESWADLGPHNDTWIAAKDRIDTYMADIADTQSRGGEDAEANGLSSAEQDLDAAGLTSAGQGEADRFANAAQAAGERLDAEQGDLPF